jgi:hypothetical protein
MNYIIAQQRNAIFRLSYKASNFSQNLSQDFSLKRFYNSNLLSFSSIFMKRMIAEKEMYKLFYF